MCPIIVGLQAEPVVMSYCYKSGTGWNYPNSFQPRTNPSPCAAGAPPHAVHHPTPEHRPMLEHRPTLEHHAVRAKPKHRAVRPTAEAFRSARTAAFPPPRWVRGSLPAMCSMKCPTVSARALVNCIHSWLRVTFFLRKTGGCRPLLCFYYKTQSYLNRCSWALTCGFHWKTMNHDPCFP